MIRLDQNQWINLIKINFHGHIFWNDYFMVAIHRFTVFIWFYCYIIMKQKGKGYQEIGAIHEAFDYEKEVTSNVAVTMKNGKQCQTTAISIYHGAAEHFQIKLPWYWWFYWWTNAMFKL